MGDLISRKAFLKEIISKCGCVPYLEGTNKTTLYIDEVINNLPTAYDVDKIIEQIEERKTDNLRVAKLKGNSDYKKLGHICRADEDDYVIRIVKGAVKDE